MRREQELRAEYLMHLVLEPRERRAAGVAVVADEHGGRLAVAHRVDAGICEHVEEDVLILQQEGVVARLGDGRGAALDGLQVQLLHHAHLVQLEGDVHAGVEFDVGHFLLSLSHIAPALWRRRTPEEEKKIHALPPRQRTSAKSRVTTSIYRSLTTHGLIGYAQINGIYTLSL